MLRDLITTKAAVGYVLYYSTINCALAAAFLWNVVGHMLGWFYHPDNKKLCVLLIQ